jgi:hypothetical protein
MPADECNTGPSPSALEPPLAATSFDANKGVLRARSDSPHFLAHGSRFGANETSDDALKPMGFGCAGVARIVRAAGSMLWKAEGAAAWALEDRSRVPPECLKLLPARDGENILTFAKASVMFSLSPNPKFMVKLNWTNKFAVSANACLQ